MSEETVEKISNFYIDLFTLEWQKMVLPVLMVLILSTSALSTMDLKNSKETKDLAELSLETMTNLTEVNMRIEYFNDSVNESRKALSDEITQRASERKNSLTSRIFTDKTFLGSLQTLGMFPYTPEFDVPLPVSEKDYLTALTEASFRQIRFENLTERINSSENISIGEFEDEVADIKSVEWTDERAKTFLRNNSEPEKKTGIGSTGLTEERRNKVLDEEFTEISLTSYLPSILATFTLYYVLNAIAVQSGREIYGRLYASKRNSRQKKQKEGSSEEERKENSQEDEEGKNRKQGDSKDNKDEKD